MRPPNSDLAAASSSRWKGCGSKLAREPLDLVRVHDVLRASKALSDTQVVQKQGFGHLQAVSIGHGRPLLHFSPRLIQLIKDSDQLGSPDASE